MSDDAQSTPPQPLAGLRVVEFTHMVMGPTCGMVLADMGAEVIKIEPIDGDRTRRLLGAGSGFFPMFNRNKKSIAIDTNSNKPRIQRFWIMCPAPGISQPTAGASTAMMLAGWACTTLVFSVVIFAIQMFTISR